MQEDGGYDPAMSKVMNLILPRLVDEYLSYCDCDPAERERSGSCHGVEIRSVQCESDYCGEGTNKVRPRNRCGVASVIGTR